MPELMDFPLVTQNGTRGRVYRSSRFLDRSPTNHVQLDSGEEFEVSSAMLEVQPDGTFLLKQQRAAGAAETSVAAAPPAPALVESAPTDDTMFTEEVEMTRVSVNKVIDAQPSVRQDGDTTIIPVVEEVLVVQKRMLLKEEIRVTRRRTPLRDPKRLVLNDGEQPEL